MGYFDKIKDIAGKAVNTANDAVGGFSDATLSARKMFEGSNQNASSNQGNHEFPFLGYVFYPSGGMGMKTVFLEEHVEHGGDNVLYNEMLTVNVTHVSSNNFTDGVAQATLKSGKTISFGVRPADMVLFFQAVGYANNKINETLGERAYKYGIQSSDGNAVEIYDDYLVFKMISGMLIAQTNKKAISFTEVDGITLVPAGDHISFGFKIKGIDQPIPIIVPNFMGENAQRAVAFINQRKEVLNQEATQAASETPIAWQPFIGEEKHFPLNGAFLTVLPKMDLFNSYRLKYREVANEYAELAKNQYTKKVYDFDSFMMFYIQIYSQYLDKLLQGAVDILIAEGVWSETLDSIREKHTNKFHKALDDYNAMQNSLNITDTANQKSIDNASKMVPTLRGGGFGFKNAMKGIAQAEAFNIARGAIIGAIKSSSHVTPAQKAELYGRINTDILFNRVFLDYWNVYLTLVSCLAKNGKSIWLYNDQATQQATNIMQNLSNPNFPQDKATEVIIQILTTCPYKVDFQKMLITKFGSTQEVRDINDYFGYTNFDDIHITG